MIIIRILLAIFFATSSAISFYFAIAYFKEDNPLQVLISSFFGTLKFYIARNLIPDFIPERKKV
jgi:hypothetical protein